MSGNANGSLSPAITVLLVNTIPQAWFLSLSHLERTFIFREHILTIRSSRIEAMADNRDRCQFEQTFKE